MSTRTKYVLLAVVIVATMFVAIKIVGDLVSQPSDVSVLLGAGIACAVGVVLLAVIATVQRRSGMNNRGWM